jgi:hypothetical protein
MTIVENGNWQPIKIDDDDADYKIGLASDDFEHDVILWVYGDFESDEQRFLYATEIAKRLNAANSIIK